MKKRLDVTEYTLTAPCDKPFCAAVLSDIHGEEYGYILDRVREYSPDVIFIPGDVTHSHISTPENCRQFFADCRSLAPVFYSFGNHENYSRKYVGTAAKQTGVTLLDNAYTDFLGLHIGGLTSGFIDSKSKITQGHFKETPAPNLHFLQEFDALSGYKVLLNHHPEYYPKYLKQTGIQLILSGHAHGGQWRLFGKPVFAPGQRFFPKYAQGMHDGRLIVSRGLANNGPAPRFFNNREILILHFKKN